ncbi:MAG: hypothetical protein FWC92_04090 [Defluviitaleaceae bacterium]|nr:hypothetical protein [Defluviitaleaceae bacterium]
MAESKRRLYKVLFIAITIVVVALLAVVVFVDARNETPHELDCCYINVGYFAVDEALGGYYGVAYAPMYYLPYEGDANCCAPSCCTFSSDLSCCTYTLASLYYAHGCQIFAEFLGVSKDASQTLKDYISCIYKPPKIVNA